MTPEEVQRFLDGMAAEEARDGPPPGFPQLPTIPGGRYTDPEFLALEDKYLWKRSWLYACHTDELPDPGSFLLWRKTGSPIMILRGRDGEIRAFYNTCRHRGAPLVQEARGKIAGLVCRYHGWTYDLTGKLINLRDRRDFPGLDMSCHSLVEIGCALFGNWVFVNEDPEAEPLADALGPAYRHWQTLAIDRIRHVHSASFTVACNVKVLLDAFLETYHLKSIHQNTVDRFLNHRGTYSELYDRGNSLMVTPQRRSDWVDPGTVGMPKIETATKIQREHNPSYNIFPNLVAPLSDSGVPFLTFWPAGPKTMTIDCHWFGPEGSQDHELWPTRIRNFDAILEEDTQFAPEIQSSVESAGFKGIYLSYQERRIYHWHEELDRRIGPQRIPEHLRVKPVLRQWRQQRSAA
ncbi:MAG: aromatic ring-hydroxylating dioxygenase subunit alpha [Alphaproteobacteria bacterium]|nr:MAG: aromatic ring-hydroxylating dioxygenase subunit alpha [Alphaproteobacteria bacterium]